MEDNVLLHLTDLSYLPLEKKYHCVPQVSVITTCTCTKVLPSDVYLKGSKDLMI